MNFFSNDKLRFCAIAAIMYLVIASPPVYNLVGSILGLHNYDDSKSDHRNILLVVHGIVYFLSTLLLVNVLKMP